MNKQQMIDRAIKDLEGVYPFDSSGLNYLIKSTINNSCWGEGKYEVYQYHDLIDPSWEHICTRKEFEDRIEELNNMKEFKPTLGVMCEVTWDQEGAWWKCVVCEDITLVLFHDKWVDGKKTFTNFVNVEYRPIKTEKELTIEKALDAVEKADASCGITFLEALYDAGMLVTPKSKE